MERKKEVMARKVAQEREAEQAARTAAMRAMKAEAAKAREVGRRWGRARLQASIASMWSTPTHCTMHLVCAASCQRML